MHSLVEPQPRNSCPRLHFDSRFGIYNVVVVVAVISALQLFQKIIMDFLFCFVLFLVVAHGSAEQRTNLDVMTRNALETNSRQYKEAEREIFGRELENEDWDRMDEDEQLEKTGRLITRLKEKRKQRLNESGSQQ